ncbi:hypothetical protein [Prescottella agglutinans]|uniref:hypothetical protein n=1 Tax=Prescottella agglutinans TaxID=1644129 RepID=UPI003D982309
MDEQRHPREVRRVDPDARDLSQDDLARVIEALTGEHLPVATDQTVDQDRSMS